MKNFICTCLAVLLTFGGKALAQTGCRIETDPVAPTLCVGNQLCVNYRIVPPGCASVSGLRIEVSQALPSPGASCNFTPPSLSGPGNCITIPLTFPKGRYCVRLRSGSIVSDVRSFDVDTLDLSPSPTFQIVQLPPIRPVYCSTDTVRFKIVNLSNAGVGYTIQWSKNDSTRVGFSDSTFSITGLFDGDFVRASVTKQSKCASNATGRSDSISLRVGKNPLIKVSLAPGSTGCESSVNSFRAKIDSAGPDAYVYWIRLSGGRADTLSQGIYDTTFTLTPADSAKFGDQICAQVLTGRCKLEAVDCFTIRACGQVFLDPPIDTVACAGSLLRVPYTITGTFLPANLFRVQLSDATGSFSSPVQIGTLLSGLPDTIASLIPVATPPGNCYRIRIISSSPPDTSDISACIRINPRPQPPVVKGDSVCREGTVFLTAASSEPGATFAWYANPFGGNPVVENDTLSLFIRRDTTFYVSVVSAAGCAGDRIAVSGLVIPAPQVEAGPDRNACLGTGIISLNPFPAGGTWSGGLPVLNNAIDLSGVAEGEYTLFYEVAGILGCTATDSFRVRVKPIPVVNAGADFQVCTNFQPIVLTGTPSGGIWSGDNIQSDGAYLPSIASAGTDTLIYSVTQDGCTGSDTLLVQVREAPPIFNVITTNPSDCNVDDGTATLDGITTGPGFKVKWSVDRADSLSDPTLSNLGAGAYTVRVTDLSTGCFRNGAFGLSDPLAPPPVISGLSANYCSGDSCVVLTVAPNSPSGTWSGTGLTTQPDGSARFCPAQANLGPNTIVYTYDTTGGCSGTTSIITRVNPSPVVNAGGPADSVCRNAVPFQLTGFSPDAPPAIWGPQPLVSASGLVNPAQAQLGANELILTRTLATCTSSDTRTLFVFGVPAPTLSRTPTTPVCEGESVVITADPGPGIVVSRYEWFRNGVIIPNENESTLTVSQSGSYTAEAIGAGGCSGLSPALSIDFNSLPTNGVNPSGILTPCSNNPTTLTADSAAGYTFQWLSPNDPIPGQTRRQFTPVVSGQYRVRIQNALGCENFSSVVNVDVLSAPEAPVVSPSLTDTCLQSGQPITIVVGATGSGLSFQWFSVGTPDVPLVGQQDPILENIVSPGRFYLDVTASNGCKTRSDTINIKATTPITLVDSLIQKCVGDNPFVVSGFTPNTCDLFFEGSLLPGRLFNPSQIGDFTLNYQCTNSNGCVSRKDIVVRVNALPLANLVVLGPTDVCQGDSVRLVINDGTESGCAFQLLRNGVEAGPIFTQPFVRVTQPGNYSVLVTCGRCSTVSNTVPVTFRRRPRASAGQNVNACSPLNTNLNNRPGVTPGTWSGSPRVVTSGVYTSGDFTGCDVLTLTVDSSNGCTNTDTMRVCITPRPQFTVTAQNATACQAENGRAWVNEPTSGYSLEWRRIGNVTVISTADTLPAVFPGSYQVRVTDTLTGCFALVSAIINSPNNLDVGIGGLPDSVCANNPQILLAGIPADSGVFNSFGGRIVGTNRFDASLPGPAIDTVYYTASLNGCVGTAKKAIKINPLPVVDAGPDLDICFGDTLRLRAVQPAGENLVWAGPQIQNDSLYIAFDPDITTSVASFTYTRRGCTASDNKIITIRPMPVYNVVPTNVTSCGSCNGSAVREIVNSAQFQTIWRNLSTGSIIGTGGNITGQCVGTYSAQVINITTGCRKTETFGISGPTNIDPLVCLQNVPVSLCQNAPAVTIGKCNPSAVIRIAGVVTETLNPANYFPDNIEVLLTFTDTNGCTGVEQKSVEIKPVPAVNLGGTGPTFVCTNQNNLQLTGFFPEYDPSVPENGWTITGPSSGLLITRDGRINATGVTDNAIVQLTYTAKFPDPNGCSRSRTIPFRVWKTPVASIVPNVTSLTICSGSTTTLSSLNTGTGLTYSWLLGNTNPVPIGFGPSLNVSLPGVYRLQLNNNGCRSDLSGVLVLQTTEAPIIASIGQDTVVCQSTGVFSLFPPSVSGQTTERFWEPVTAVPDGFINAAGTMNPAAVSPGTYTLRFVAKRGECSDTAFRQFTIIPRIDPRIQGDQAREVCQGDLLYLVADTSGPGLSYQWLRNGVALSSSDNDSLLVTEAGTYRVRIIVNGFLQCNTPSSDFVEVTIKPSPSVSFAGEKNLKVCFPSAPFDLNTIRPYAPADASWSGPGTVVTANGLVRPANLNADGVYPLVLTKTIGTCTDTDTLYLQANVFPSRTFTASAEAICEGGEIILRYSNPSGYDVTWFRDNAAVGFADTLSLNVAGVYRLLADNNGCSVDSSASYDVRPNPTFSLRGNLEICKNGEFQQFFPENPSPGLGTWAGPGINATGGWNPASPDVPAQGPIQISYTRTSDFGCKLTKSFTILVHPVPDIALTTSRDTIEIFGGPEGPAVLRASGGLSYTWSPATGLSSTSGPEVEARPRETTEYTVSVRTDKGCLGSRSIPVVVDREFKVYDGFSPNGDNRNELWIVKNIQEYPEAEVRIYNRWGNEVFRSPKGYPQPWDGTYEGKPVPPGAYYYIIQLGPGLEPKSGSVTVVR